MESTVKERLKQYLRINSITQEKFCNSVGVAPTYVSNIRKGIQPDKLTRIRECYPDLNIEWLVTGQGNMLNTPQQAMSVINNGTNSGTMGNNVSVHTGSPCPSADDAEEMSVEVLPVIPANIVNDPSIDVIKYISENATDMEPVVQQFPEAIAWYKIKSKAMEYRICAGDMIAITPYPKGEEFIIPGLTYVISTNTNGMITRRLYTHPDGYRAVSNNPEDYPDFIIPFKHVRRIYRIVGLLRQDVI